MKIVFSLFIIVTLCSYCFAQEVNNSISGTITIPKSDKEAPLYIRFWKDDVKANRWTIIRIEVIEKPTIKGNKIEYRIDNVPDGEYYIEAFLDIAEPFIEEDELKPHQIFPWASEGDYVQASEIFKIEKGIHKNDINVELKLVKKDGKLE